MCRQQEAAFECAAADSAAPARPVAVVQLITTAALALSTLVAVTAVSIGYAHADATSITTPVISGNSHA
jgi:hypothetical protein